MPVLRLMAITFMPSGTRKSTIGVPFSASSMKSLKIGAARPPPVEPLPSALRLVVAHIEADDEVRRVADEPGVLLVVGRAGLAGDRPAELGDGDVAVPRCTTPSIIEVIW